MFYAIVQIQLLQVEGTRLVISTEHFGGEIGHKVAKSFGKVICRVDPRAQLFEGYIFPIVWQDTWGDSA